MNFVEQNFAIEPIPIIFAELNYTTLNIASTEVIKTPVWRILAFSGGGDIWLFTFFQEVVNWLIQLSRNPRDVHDLNISRCQSSDFCA